MYLFAVVSCKLSVSWALVIPCGYQNTQNKTTAFHFCEHTQPRAVEVPSLEM